MNWYWWLVGVYYIIPALASILVIGIAIKGEIDKNLRSRSPDYWLFIKNCGTYCIDDLVFCVAFIPLMVEAFVSKKKEVK